MYYPRYICRICRKGKRSPPHKSGLGHDFIAMVYAVPNRDGTYHLVESHLNVLNQHQG